MQKFMTGVTILGAIVLGMIFAIAQARADDLDVFQKQAINPVVQLERNCSGTVINIGDAKTTYILTANHCTTEEAAPDAQRGYVLIDNKVRGKLIDTSQLVYDLVVRDVSHDLAILKLRKEGLNLPTAKIAKEDPREGEDVWTIGYPLGLTKTVTQGHMGDYETINNDMGFDQFGDDGRTMYRATPAIYGGNSGGGFFMKRNGEYVLVGVADAGFRSFFVAGYYVTQKDVNELVDRALKTFDPTKVEQKKAND